MTRHYLVVVRNTIFEVCRVTSIINQGIYRFAAGRGILLRPPSI